jgi:hypothetical protein
MYLAARAACAAAARPVPAPAGRAFLPRPAAARGHRSHVRPAGPEECRVHVDRALQLGIGSMVWSMLVRPIICSLLDVRSISGAETAAQLGNEFNVLTLGARTHSEFAGLASTVFKISAKFREIR